MHHIKTEKLPPLREKVETIEVLRQTNKATAALAELVELQLESINVLESQKVGRETLYVNRELIEIQKQ
ncbi:hypothetical protein ACT3CE_09020 [Marinifilum sp. RC60d5]|uniref:hypothetical protein n=1 Tax=Marinifilum sp. RC60d5 TaxID=3458414 RepID=UPI004036C57A